MDQLEFLRVLELLNFLGIIMLHELVGVSFQLTPL